MFIKLFLILRNHRLSIPNSIKFSYFCKINVAYLKIEKLHDLINSQQENSSNHTHIQ